MLRAMRWLIVVALGSSAAYYIVKLLRGEPAPVFSGVESSAPLAPPARSIVVPKPAPQAEPEPVPVQPQAAAPWIAAEGTPPPDTHPVKAKLKSGIYHLPGMLNYDRTVPDRWYLDAEAAEADGLRKAKR